MEIDYFLLKKSSSGEYYFINKVTGKSQWGSDTYFYIKKRLPKGWIRLDYNGNPLYKYIGGKIESTRSLVYSPKYIKELEILQKSFEDLDKEDEEEREEAHRKQDLFKKVADLLKLTPESIRDESVQFLAKKANILPQIIIDFIEITELIQLGKRAILTPFSTIKRTDGSFSSERSIRELCGVNMREAEASEALNELEDLSCPIKAAIFKEPFFCSCGHTFEREAIIDWLQSGKTTCPGPKCNITNYISPNHFARRHLHRFVEKYEHQRGHIWSSVAQECSEFRKFSGARLEPEHVSYLPARSIHDDSIQREWLEGERLNDEARESHRRPGRTDTQIREYIYSKLPIDEDDFRRVCDIAIDIVLNNTERSYSDADRIFNEVYEQQGPFE
jgi:hypothetical protein